MSDLEIDIHDTQQETMKNCSLAENKEQSERSNSLRSATLSAGPDREYHLTNHPIYQRPVQILTNAIKDAFLIASDAVRFKRLGCSFLADFRAGKSTALEMIARHLTDVLPDVASQLVSAITHDAVTERTFYGDLLIAFGLPIDGSAQDRSSRLRGAIITACINAGGRHFCLFIDEGQNWGGREYTFLRDFSNQLRQDDRYVLSTVIFGDLRLEELASSFRSKRKDLWARFLMKPESFAGIRSIEDLKFFLSEYDNIKRCEYPAGSKLSYSEFFLPLAYASGWRLADEAQNAWDAFVRSAASVNRKLGDIGMQWVGDTVTQFLTGQMAIDVAKFKSTPDDWDAAVLHSKFIDSLI
ncbi:ATP-binding protein [Azonexus sp. R2A61]|uniref:ATP-binding protein n=1 Tax=Azonexus sp. R2A61 TaxID=2744443 RepID=UPI001F47695E|nr:ATP-binding protein [Azonexus sp. R2A61]